MLKTLTLKNFKSYREATLPIAPLTVLVGANASGKSNLIEALQLLSFLAARNPLSNLPKEKIIRGMNADMFQNGVDKLEFTCEMDTPDLNRAPLNITSASLSMGLEMRHDELHIAYEELYAMRNNGKLDLYGHIRNPQGSTNNITMWFANFARGGTKPHITCNDQTPVFTQLNSQAAFGMGYDESAKHITPLAGAYAEVLSSIAILDAVPARMREFSHPREQRKQLDPDAKNISAVLYNLCKNSTENEQHIFNFIKSLPEQDVLGLDFLEDPLGRVMMRAVESFGGEKKYYPATLLSDGTLRILAIATMLLSAKKGNLVVIEEIDNGLHPSRARHLLEQIILLGRERNLRILISTHNPALLDALPDSAVDDTIFCYRDKNGGDSRLVRIADIPHYPELILQGSFGHLVTQGMLDRFVKNPRSEEERDMLFTQWLNELKKGTGV